MLGTHDLALFVVSGLLLNITPGADSLYIATRSMTQGVRAGEVITCKRTRIISTTEGVST